jgi:nicotinate dehydrogenase subunit A
MQAEGAVVVITMKVNGAMRSVAVEPDTPLLYVLRNDLGLNGPKFGCGLGQCGACTVLLGGEPTRSCVTPIQDVGADEVTTIEGLGTLANPHPLQKAFIDEQAAQCGYCINGMIMMAAEMLKRIPQPSAREVRGELARNLCRCGTHNRIVRAVLRAAEAMGKT